MANEITYTGKGDFFIAAALNRMLYENIVDRTDLSRTVTYYGSANGAGSTASKISKATFDDPMVAANTDEVTPIGNTDLGTGSATITVARQALSRDLSDIYQLIGEGGPSPDAARFASDMADAAVLRITDMICALFGSLSSIVGVSGVNMALDDLYEGLYVLIRARAGGQKIFVGSPQQVTDLIDSIRNEGQKLTPPDATDLLSRLGNQENWGFHGTFAGVQIWSADSVVTNGPDSEGGLYTEKAFGLRDGVPQAAMTAAAPGSFMSATPNGSPVFVEFERDAKAGLTSIVGNLYVGVAEIDDAHGVLMRNSAT
jgi:hypothetical protein